MGCGARQATSVDTSKGRRRREETEEAGDGAMNMEIKGTTGVGGDLLVINIEYRVVERAGIYVKLGGSHKQETKMSGT